MAKFISSAPVLFVRDVRASAEHYRDAMGFRFDRFYGDPPSFVILGRDGLHVMLKSTSDHSAIVPRWNVSPNLWDMYFGLTMWRSFTESSGPRGKDRLRAL
jgi:hypothetical protein